MELLVKIAMIVLVEVVFYEGWLTLRCAVKMRKNFVIFLLVCLIKR